jgi:hypothetical protein
MRGCQARDNETRLDARIALLLSALRLDEKYLFEVVGRNAIRAASRLTWLPSCILEKHRSVVISRSVAIVFSWRREQSGRLPCSPREIGKREVVQEVVFVQYYGDLTQLVLLDGTCLFVKVG